MYTCTPPRNYVRLSARVLGQLEADQKGPFLLAEIENHVNIDGEDMTAEAKAIKSKYK